MTLTVYRCGKAAHRDSLFDGIGGLYVSGRWTPQGLPVVYTSEHASLAILEHLANYRQPQWLPATVLAAAEIPEQVHIEEVDLATLPKGWNDPVPPESLKKIGKNWLARGQTGVLKAPSALVPDESNYLLNPRHPQFRSIRFSRPKEYFPDERLL